MCLIAFAWQAHADYPLIVAANRDEFFVRPTASADWWDDGRRLAGRDLRAGGTWMGVSKSGRFAALTNVRDPASQKVDAPSRGELVSSVLDDGHTLLDSLEHIGVDASRYNGFNLLAAQWDRDAARGAMWILSGRGDTHRRPIEAGIHALSNASLDTPWPKVERARGATQLAIEDATDRDDLCARLFALLDDRAIANDSVLPRTGVTLDIERALSAAYIRMPGYGTRSSTVYVVDCEGAALFIERRSEPGSPVEERRFAFQIESHPASPLASHVASRKPSGIASA